MDFNDTPQEATFRAEVRDWLSKNAKPRTESGGILSLFSEGDSGDGDGRGEAEWEMVRKAKAWQAKKADAGWAGITWPKKFGGRGGTIMQQVIWGQEESKYDIPPNIFMLGVSLAAPTIMTHGTEEQKQRYLPKILRGDEIWCQCFSEPSAGSDLAGLRTRAEQKGDEWIVNGSKIWTSGAHYSEFGILVTRTDPTVPKHKGLTYFILDMKSPGVEIRAIKQTTGGANFNEVFFTDVRIPDKNRVDAVGNGWAVAITTLMNERMSIGGDAGSMIDVPKILKALNACYVDGRPALKHDGVRQKLAGYLARIKGLELTGQRTISALSQGAVPGPEGSIMKLTMGVLLQEMSAFLMDVQGAAAALTDPAETLMDGTWQSTYLGVPGIRIAGGADEVQRNIISERVLGLPTDVRFDKDVPFNQVPSGAKR